jgi:hypothetical protein
MEKIVCLSFLRLPSISGITANKLANLAHVPLESVYKRIYDLRVIEGKAIYSNYRTVNGQRKMFYRIAS